MYFQNNTQLETAFFVRVPLETDQLLKFMEESYEVEGDMYQRRDTIRWQWDLYVTSLEKVDDSNSSPLDYNTSTDR